ncbi:MAG: phage integrase SAM-like domain-containing protein [Thermoleophilaceae bacterium]|nr:phage integrase SAM-like domain-containing protein [Thermoleophilaceae bacterium]
MRLRDLDRAAVQRFVDWLTSLPGRNRGAACDRSVANALTPLRAALDAAVAEGMPQQNPSDGVVLLAPPRRPRVGVQGATLPDARRARAAARRDAAEVGAAL